MIGRREVLGFVVRVAAWLPLCLVGWSLSGPIVDFMPARLSRLAVGLAGQVEQVTVVDRVATYELVIPAAYRPGRALAAEASVEVGVAKYTFGIAIFLALVLASRARPSPGRAGLSLVAVIVLPAVGIGLEALQRLAAAPELTMYIHWGPVERAALGLGYQAGALLMPTLVPIAAWLWLFRDDAWPGLGLLSQSRRQAHAGQRGQA